MYKNSSGGSTYENCVPFPHLRTTFPYFQVLFWGGGGILVKYKFGATWKRVGASSRVILDPPLKEFIQERRIIYLNDHLPWAVSYQLLHQMIQCARPYSASDIDLNVQVPHHWVILFHFRNNYNKCFIILIYLSLFPAWFGWGNNYFIYN